MIMQNPIRIYANWIFLCGKRFVHNGRKAVVTRQIQQQYGQPPSWAHLHHIQLNQPILANEHKQKNKPLIYQRVFHVCSPIEITMSANP